MKIFTRRHGALLFACGMTIYSFTHVCSLFIVFYKDVEPEWITLFKLQCDFLLLPSSILLVIAINKDNLTIVRTAEISFLSTSLGFLIYTIVHLILFVKEKELGIPFYYFIAQRTFFFAFEFFGSLNLHKYRHGLKPRGDEDVSFCGRRCHRPKEEPSCGVKVENKVQDRERIVPFRPATGNLTDACGIERRLANSSNIRDDRTMPVYTPGPGSAPPPPPVLPEMPSKPISSSKRKKDFIELKNAPSALKFLKPCPYPQSGFVAPNEFTGQECFKNLEGGRSPGTGTFGSSTKYSGYPPIRGCQSCGNAGGQTWQSKGTLKLTSARPIAAADLEGIRNIRGLGIGFPGSLGLCKDMPGPGTYGGTYTARKTPAKSAVSVPKCY